MKCGKELEHEEQEYCSDCIHIQKHYTRGYPLYRYEDPVKEGVLAFKYKNRREYAQFYAEELEKQYGSEFLRLNLDGVLPVPIHPHKLRTRGYNQAGVLAKELGRRLDIPYYEKQLVRTVDTRPQKELNDKERLQNLKKAFFFRENDVKLNKVLLVDDIYTTGATIEACTQSLHSGGVQEVYYTSICIGRGSAM